MPRNEKHYFICQFCNTEFYAPKSAWTKPKYCSKQCHNDFQRSKRPKKDCEYCGNSFEIKTKKQRFCSVDCRIKGTIDHSKKGKFICEWCEKEFVNWKSRPNRFCSKQCLNEFAARQPKPRETSGKVKLVCKICGSSYTTSRFFAEQRNSYFCSRACKGKDRSNKMRGKNNPNWQGGFNPSDYGPNWESQARRVRKRDDYTCQICGYKSRFKNLDVHHIKPLRLFNGDYEVANQLNNLICLCRKCHRNVETGKTPCPIPKQV